MLLGFEHVGMTVSDMDRTLDFYVNLIGMKLVTGKTSANGGRIAFLDAGGGMLEIVAPANGALASKDVRPGHAGLRHLTFRVDDVETVFTGLEQAGVEIVEYPRLAANQELIHKVAFVRDPDGIIVELVERSSTFSGR